MTRFVAAVAAAALLAGAAGCGSDTATVSGVVTYQGRPAAGGSVILHGPDSQLARGVIGPDGRYSIPNAPRGSAQVTVQSHARQPAGFGMKQQLPPSVGGPVPPTAGPADARVPFPLRYAVPEESGLTVAVDREQVTFNIDLVP